MSRATKQQPDVAALAAEAAVGMIAALASDVEALGADGDTIKGALYDAVVGDTIDEALDPLLALVPDEQLARQIGSAAFEHASRREQFGYLLGVEVGKRIAGGGR